MSRKENLKIAGKAFLNIAASAGKRAGKAIASVSKKAANCVAKATASAADSISEAAMLSFKKAELKACNKDVRNQLKTEYELLGRMYCANLNGGTYDLDGQSETVAYLIEGIEGNLQDIFDIDTQRGKNTDKLVTTIDCDHDIEALYRKSCNPELNGDEFDDFFEDDESEDEQDTEKSEK